jgi:uncharacterized protein YjbI with pentapeptide repeats
MRQCILTKAKCVQTRFVNADLTYADFSHADLTAANLYGARMFRTKLHGIKDQKAVMTDRESALGNDPELMKAENWKPVY